MTGWGSAKRAYEMETDEESDAASEAILKENADAIASFLNGFQKEFLHTMSTDDADRVEHCFTVDTEDGKKLTIFTNADGYLGFLVFKPKGEKK